MIKLFKRLFRNITGKRCLLCVVGSLILAFGLYNIHAQSAVTEGGVLGLTLLLKHWFGISPAISSFLLDGLCYLLGVLTLGREFIIYSFIASGGFSLFYALFEQFDPLWPSIGEHPLIAALIGAVFVGIGAGLAVRAGGATGGDDALAMSFSKILKIKIQWIYLFTDLSVLLLSLTYIPLRRILYSVLTVVLSGQILGYVKDFSRAKIKQVFRRNKKSAE